MVEKQGISLPELNDKTISDYLKDYPNNYIQSTKGLNLYLTIDLSMQLTLDRVLKNAYKQ